MSEATQEPEIIENVELPEVPDEPETPAYRAWETEEAKEKELPQHIPYNRFKEVNDERKTYLTRLEEAESKLAQYQEREEQVKKIKSPDDIKIENYTDPALYLKDLTEATKYQAVLEVEERQRERDRQKAIDDKVKATNNLFTTNVNEAVKRNPDIKNAHAWFDKVADNIHPVVAYELMIDENVGELMYDIATNQDLVNEMFTSDPQSFIRKLHKMSARINREERYSGERPTERDPNRTTTPRALDKREQIRSSIPSTVRTSGSNSGNNLLRAKSASEYIKMKRALNK